MWGEGEEMGEHTGQGGEGELGCTLWGKWVEDNAGHLGESIREQTGRRVMGGLKKAKHNFWNYQTGVKP